MVERDLRSINETDQILVKRERWVGYEQGFDGMGKTCGCNQRPNLVGLVTVQPFVDIRHLQN